MWSLETASIYTLPLVAFAIGIGGSLHCGGMCGPLVVSFAPTRLQNWLYQIGRLIGYLTLCFFVSFIGQATLEALSPKLRFAASIFIGLGFLILGVSLFSGKRISFVTHLTTGDSFKKVVQFLHRFQGKGFFKPFAVGYTSILLPCGLLYGTVFSLIAMHGFYVASLSVFFFWVGTLPAMVLGPQAFRRVLMPLASKMPRFIGVLCILVGVLTLVMRVHSFSTSKVGEDAAIEGTNTLDLESCH